MKKPSTSKGKPLKDGSGGGTGNNKGRGGCENPKGTREGKNTTGKKSK